MTEPAASTRSARGAAEIVRFLEEHQYRHVFGLPGSSIVAALHRQQDSPTGESGRPAIEHAWTTADQGPNAVILTIPFEDEL